MFIYALVWSAAFSAALPSFTVIEKPRFYSHSECMDWGRKMSPRFADYSLGLRQLDWDTVVRISFVCPVAGLEI